MPSYNKVILIGHCTRDPELRFLQSGMAVCDIGLAVSEKRKDAGGQMVEEVVFVDITAWNKTAEIAAEYLKKGSQAMVEGRLKLDSWTTQDNQKRTKLKVVCDKLVLLGFRENNQSPQQSQAPQPRTQSNPQAASYAPPSDGEEIPF